MLDSGIKKAVDNLRIKLSDDLQRFLDGDKAPTEKQWERFKTEVSKYIEVKKKVDNNE
jgi:hypothetical protein